MRELRDDLIGDGGPGGALRAAMANFATGVTVVTAVDQAGTTGQMVHAMTANSFTAISLDPPLIMVSVRKVGRFHPVMEAAGRWAVSILGSGQGLIARHYAVSGRELATQFDDVETTTAPISGAPLINGAIAWLECETERMIDAGDHTMMLGRVLAAHRADDDESEPLLYFRGSFHRPNAAD